MTSKPSRSEIENALSGRTNRSRAKPQKPRQNVDFDFEVSPRRQQVIGGDLTGISKRPKYGIFSRYAEVSIANWVAGAIVLLIVGAFFWPQGGESIREVAEKKAQQTGQSIYTESRIEEADTPATPEADVTFSRETDLERAAEFRGADELEAQVRTLLDAAERSLASRAYTQPKDNNAASTFKEVLALDPGNVSARQGLDKINTILLSAGLGRLDKDQKTKAEEVLTKLSIIDTESDAYQELSGAIETWEIDRTKERFLTKAKKAKQAQKLILPAKENALYYYRQALEIDEDNAVALAGIKSIADNYIDRTNEAMLKGQFQAASGYLATVSVIDAQHPSIPLMEALIAKAEPIVKKAAEASSKQTEKSAEQAKSDTSDSKQQENSEPASPSDSNAEVAKSTAATDKSSTPSTVSASKTPSKEAGEQAAFDREYLKLGLDSYYKGEYDTAAALLQPLADKGVSRAQFRIGYMYFLGRGFKKNRQEADRVIRAALPAIQKFANDGRTWAQSDLGSLYEDGLVLPRNYTEAVYWYRSAAEKGYPGAQTNLGIMYALGRGVTSNRSTAVDWFQRAAAQGDIVAKRNLEALGVSVN